MREKGEKGGKRALAAWLLRIGTAQSRFAGHRGFLTGRGEAERVGPGESGRSEADPVDSLAVGGFLDEWPATFYVRIEKGIAG